MALGAGRVNRLMAAAAACDAAAPIPDQEIKNSPLALTPKGMCLATDTLTNGVT